MADFLPFEQHYLRLAKKAVSGGVLYLNDQHEALLVKPSYRGNWTIPGGSSEAMESPYVAAQREVAEELGNQFPVQRLLIIDYHQRDGSREFFNFTFFGGILNAKQIANISLPKDELTEFGFYDLEKAKNMLGSKGKYRVDAYVKAIKTGQIVYLENGQEIK